MTTCRAFPRPSVQGHAGRLVLGRIAGVPVACLSGRAHLYEGVGPAPLEHARAHAEGHRLPRAAADQRRGLAPARIGRWALVLVEDHINLQGTNPLVGANDERSARASST